MARCASYAVRQRGRAAGPDSERRNGDGSSGVRTSHRVGFVRFLRPGSAPASTNSCGRPAGHRERPGAAVLADGTSLESPQGDRCARQIFLVAEQLQVVVRDTFAIVVVQMDCDDIDGFTEPVLGFAKPLGGPLQRGRQVVVTELDRSIGNALNLIAWSGGLWEIHGDAGVVEFESDRFLTHCRRVTPSSYPALSPSRTLSNQFVHQFLFVQVSPLPVEIWMVAI
jgi:hypothetical protein